MWSGPVGDPNAISFGQTSSQFCSFRVDRAQDNARLYVYNPYSDGTLWIDADAVGPAQPPERRPGPKPANANCADAIYDGSGPPAQAAPPRPAEATPATVDLVIPTPAVRPVSSDVRLGQPLVMALYYPWYDFNTWEGGKTLDLPQVPYESADPATAARHVAWAMTSRLG